MSLDHCQEPTECATPHLCYPNINTPDCYCRNFWTRAVGLEVVAIQVTAPGKICTWATSYSALSFQFKEPFGSTYPRTHGFGLSQVIHLISYTRFRPSKTWLHWISPPQRDLFSATIFCTIGDAADNASEDHFLRLFSSSRMDFLWWGIVYRTVWWSDVLFWWSISTLLVLREILAGLRHMCYSRIYGFQETYLYLSVFVHIVRTYI